MKKFTKAILGTTACLLMGASTIGLSGCISSTPTDLTDTNTKITEITTTLTTETTKLEEEIKNLQEQIDELINTDYTNSLEEEVKNLQEQIDELINTDYTNSLEEEVKNLQNQVNQLLNKQDRLTHDEAFELIMYASNKINFSKQNNVNIEMSVKGTIDDGTDDGMYAEVLQTTEKIISNTYGEVVRYSYTTESGSVMVAPYDEQLCFKYNNHVYAAYLINNEIADFYEYPTGIYEQALNIYTMPMSQLFEFSKDDICFTSTNGSNHIIHINKTETVDIIENSEKVGTKDMVYLIKFEIDNDANVISLEQEKKAISSTVANYDLEKDYLKTTATATPIEENKNLAEIETKMAKIIKHLNTPQINSLIIEEIDEPIPFSVGFTQKVFPGDEISMVCQITNSSDTDLEFSFTENKTATLTLAGQDITATGLEYFEAKEANFYSDSNLTQEISTSSDIKIVNGQTIYLKLVLKVKDTIPASLNGISLSDNAITFINTFELSCEEVLG